MTGEVPVLADVVEGGVEGGGGFGIGAAEVEHELDDAGGAGVELFHLCEGVFQGQEGFRGEGGAGAVEEVGVDGLAFEGGAGAGTVNQDLAHGAGGEGEEVVAVGDVFGEAGGELFSVEITDEDGGGEGGVGGFAGGEAAGDALEFGVDDGDGLLLGEFVAEQGFAEEDRQVLHLRLYRAWAGARKTAFRNRTFMPSR